MLRKVQKMTIKFKFKKYKFQRILAKQSHATQYHIST